MGNPQVRNEKESWMGRVGFDEARYYEDDIAEISSDHPDEEIVRKVEESYSRNVKLASSDIKVRVTDGLVILEGQVPGLAEKKEASDSIQTLSGVKAVKNLIHYQGER